VLWATILAGGTGLVLGLHFRVPAVLAASVVAAAASIATAFFMELPLLTGVVVTLGLLSTLQGGYLVGALARARFCSSQAGPRAFSRQRTVYRPWRSWKQFRTPQQRARPQGVLSRLRATILMSKARSSFIDQCRSWLREGLAPERSN
jgi:hypothetical protein